MSTVGSEGADTVPAKTAATLLGVSKWTVTRWCRGGRLPGAVQPGPPWQTGQPWRIPAAAVQALLTPHTSEATE